MPFGTSGESCLFSHGVEIQALRPHWGRVANVESHQEPGEGSVVVFRGTRSLCHEFSLVLEAKDIEHETRQDERSWILSVPSAVLSRAHDEITRYAAERSVPRRVPDAIKARPGAAIGAIAYVSILLLTAYCAGNGWFGADWLSIGDLQAGAPGEWWH